ncbi:MAG: ATP-binding protein, partial [Candidatus Acidiferrales bacterium]
TGIDITYEKSGHPYPVDSSAAIHIYRVLQEALNNVARHSGAREAWVRLRFQPDSLQLEIEDHGKGLNSDASAATAKTKPGMGLVAMRERAELLSATIELLRLPQNGTLVRLQVPKERLEPHAP